jgi:tRNA-specific 2-thiouridylase
MDETMTNISTTNQSTSTKYQKHCIARTDLAIQPVVFVGMSGGVDSSVSAALLQEAGYDVYGVFIRVWSPPWMPCTQEDDRKEAEKVAMHLGIPFEVLDLSETYKKEIVDDMIAEYAAGRVPNPDVLCNKYVKFGEFLAYALSKGADFVATGHYARAASPEKSGFFKKKRDIHQLLRGHDTNKDQSYFLWTLGQKELSQALFPVGGYKKSEVRALAKEFNLPTATRKESQGLCFIGHIDLKEFLSHYIDPKEGNVFSKDGQIIGIHDGAHFFTLGQRHGFTITQKGTDDAPYYVVAKDIINNTITVAHEPDIAHWETKEMRIGAIHWVGEVPKEGKKYGAQTRYRGKVIPCTLKHVSKSEALVFFRTPVLTVPGQSLVIYNGDVCMGGGKVIA